MEKLIKRVISVVCAIAMVVTCLTFTPATVKAEVKDVPNGVEAQAGAFYLKATNESWAGWSTMQYETKGNEYKDTRIILKNSAQSWYNDTKPLTYIRVPNFTSTQTLEADQPYKVQIKMNLKSDAFNPSETDEETGKNYLAFNVEGQEMNVEVKNTGDITLETPAFDHNEFATSHTPSENPKDLYIYTAGLPTGSEIVISEIKMIKQESEWTPVPNWNIDAHPEGTPAEFTPAGAVKLLAMYTPSKGKYGKLKYKVANLPEGTEPTMKDTTILKTTEGYKGSWATTARLENFLSGLTKNEQYDIKLKVKSSKATGTDDHGQPKTLVMAFDGQSFEKPLSVGTQEFTFNDVEYRGTGTNVDFELEQLDPGTELVIEDLTITEKGGWTALPNEKTEKYGGWELFARTCTGEGDDNSQWGALSYKKAEDVAGEPTEMKDTMIKVRSASGWRNAWATMATLPKFIKGKLEVGKKYEVKVTYASSKATKTDMYGVDKELVVSVDDNNLGMKLEKTDDMNTFVTRSAGQFRYEAQKTQNDPDAVVFNLDEVEAGTILRIKAVEFVEVNDGWIPIPNKLYTQAGNTCVELYARMGTTLDEASWGKTSYRIDGADTDYANVTVETRSTSGWFVTNNPASIMDFKGIAADQMSKANRYKAEITLVADRTDEVKSKDGTDKETKNNIKLVLDRTDIAEEVQKTKEFVFEAIPDGQEVTLSTADLVAAGGDEYFTYDGLSDDVRLVLDEMTPGATLKVKNIKFVKDTNDKDWKEVQDDNTQKVGPWALYCTSDAITGTWGKMYYDAPTENIKMGDVSMYCYSTSGWFAGKTGIAATLPNYTKDLGAGKNYSVAITITSSKDVCGKDDKGNDKRVRVVINDSNYDLEVYKGTFTYIIPRLSSNYDTTKSSNVVFNFDAAYAGTQFNISNVEFKTNTVDTPAEISSLSTKVNADGTVTVNWEQTPNTVYYGGKFKVYVDGVATDVTGNLREYTTGKLADGDHTIQVTALIGGAESAGMSKKVNVAPATSAAPTTKAPTPTSKAPVKAPGKATVKKAVKAKKSAKKVKVTLKAVAGAAGYQVKVSKTKSGKALVTKFVTSLKTTIKSKKLKGKKTVYVKARAYALNGTTKVFGAWSKAKKSKKK